MSTAEQSIQDAHYEEVFERHKGPNPLFCNSLNVVFLSYLATRGGLSIEGQQHIPEGAGILSPNHGSHLDTAALGSAVIGATGKHTHFAAKEEFWEGPFAKIIGSFVGLGGEHKVKRREHLEQQPELLKRGQKIAKKGDLWVIYYNGTRVDQSLPIVPRAVKTGPILLSKIFDMPIIPTGVAGVVEKDHMSVSFQEPIQPEEFEFEMNDIKNASGLREVSHILKPSRELLARRAQEAKTRAEVFRKYNLSK